ncbi:MAG: hydrolase 1, exosortase A system-associated, partial [Thauera sp.]
GVVLWGLGDGATAATFSAPRDPRVRALMLLNPWVKTAAGEARAYLKHYYLRRLCSRSFWVKLLRGGVALRRSLGEVRGAALKARNRAGDLDDTGDESPLPDRLLVGLVRAGVPWKVLLSGRDYVAREFEQVASTAKWASLAPFDHVHHIPAADHTFSSAVWRDEVASATLKWVLALNATDRAA